MAGTRGIVASGEYIQVAKILGSGSSMPCWFTCRMKA